MDAEDCLQGLVFTQAPSQWESSGWLLSALLQASIVSDFVLD